MKHVLFVCSGNTCRSPMAEAILKDLIKDMPVLWDKLRVSSAGIMAREGDKMTGAAQEALSKLSILKLSIFSIPGQEHKARCVSQGLVESADLILAMEKRHIEALLQRYPQARGKAHTLYGYAANAMDRGVSDPYGQPLAEYIRVARELHALISSLIPMLERFVLE